MTSGFTSVTNSYISSILKKTLELLQAGKIQMTDYKDFFEKGYQLKRGKDVYHYLDKVSAQNFDGQIRGLCHRTVRSLVSIYKLKSKEELAKKIDQILEYLSNCYDGEKNLGKTRNQLFHRLISITALCPPKPNEFDITVSIGKFWTVFGT